mmetsp:Transcript_8777/g.18175  ORF Transcript_8777/g.18175 Transcript_8777/m.18175 type:complete len:88 (+) Transcript_8777:189-452(+)
MDYVPCSSTRHYQETCLCVLCTMMHACAASAMVNVCWEKVATNIDGQRPHRDFGKPCKKRSWKAVSMGVLMWLVVGSVGVSLWSETM